MFADAQNHPAISMFKDMLAIPSPSGHEAQLAAYIQKKLEHLGFDYETDAAGNILVRIGGESGSPKFVFAAHMDEIGLSVTRVLDDGSLTATRRGGLHPWKHGEGPIELLGREKTVRAILSLGSGHSLDPNSPISWDKVRILTGLTAEQLKAAGIQAGTPAVPIQEHRGPIFLGEEADPMVAAWTFDDRMGCVALLRLLSIIKRQNLTPAFSMIVAFTVQEEVGGLGAKSLCAYELPDVFIAIDGSPIPPNSDLRLDGRPALWAQDRYAIYDAELNDAFSAAAQSAGSSCQIAVHEQAASDASLVFYSGGVGRIVCFGHVRANSHGYEVARLSVFDNMLNTLVAFIKSAH